MQKPFISPLSRRIILMRFEWNITVMHWRQMEKKTIFFFRNTRGVVKAGIADQASSKLTPKLCVQTEFMLEGDRDPLFRSDLRWKKSILFLVYKDLVEE